MRPSITAPVVCAILLLSLAPAFMAAAGTAPRDMKDLAGIEASHFSWGPAFEVAAGAVSSTEVLVSEDQDVLVLWSDGDMGFSWLTTDGAVTATGRLTGAGDGWAAALDGTDILVLSAGQDGILTLQRFTQEGTPDGAPRVITIDTSGLSSPSIAVSDDGNVHMAYIAHRHGSPQATYLSMKGDDLTLVTSRDIAPDATVAVEVEVVTGDADDAIVRLTTAEATYVMSIDRCGDITWERLLYYDGEGRSPSTSVRDGNAATTWHDGTDLHWAIINAQGSVVSTGSEALQVQAGGTVSTGIDHMGIIHAVADTGGAVIHTAIGPGEGVLLRHDIATGLPPSAAPVIAVDDYDALHAAFRGASLFYCFGSTYSFQVTGTEVPAAISALHPGDSARVTMTMVNRGGLVDALGVEASVVPASKGWTATVVEDEVYLSREGEAEASVVVTAPSSGGDGDTATVSVRLWSLSMPAKSMELDLTAYMVVDLGVSIATEGDDTLVHVPPGLSKDVTVTVTNTGEVEEDILLTVTVNTGHAGSEGWHQSLSGDHLTLDPQEAADVILTVTAPLDGAGEVAVVDLVATVAQDIATSERAPVYVMAMPDVSIDVQVISAGDDHVLPGHSIEYLIEIANDGMSGSEVEVLLEVVSGVGDWHAYLQTDHITVPGGGSTFVPLTVEAPEGALEGSRFVARVKARGEGTSSEAVVDVVTYVSKWSSIKASMVNRYAASDPGDEAVYTFTITNEGNGMEFVAFRSETPFGWDPVGFSYEGDRIYSYTVDVGETLPIEAHVKVPKMAGADDYDLKLFVIDGQVKGLDIITHVNMVSDVWLSATETVREAVDGRATFDFKVKNYGNGPDEVGFFARGLPQGWEVTFPEFPSGFIELPIGKERWLSMEVHVPEDIHDEEVEFELGAIPLRGDGVYIRLMVRVITPDLEITGIDFSTDTFVVGDIETVSVTVVNHGPGPAGRVAVLAEDNRRPLGEETIQVIRPDSELIVTFTWAVSDDGYHTLRFTVDPSDKVFEKREDNNQEEIRVRATARTPAEPGSPVGAIAGATITMTLAVAGGAVAATEWGRFKLIWLFWVPLYTKLKRTSVLDHFLRGQVYGYIKANPGEHYNAIKKALGLKNGTLVYHLQTLEREEYVKSVSDGRYKRFYPAGMKVPEIPAKRLNKIQEIILKIIAENPGISQKEIADEIGLSGATINYHINVMLRADAIRVEKVGRKTQCYVLEDEEEELSPPPSPPARDTAGDGGPGGA